jgi:D-beta-D-heptose 7-phosphate kinase/D-beta-D-heptose 1-phosphate adenosyltransferase
MTIVIASGYFDPIHIGHIRYLQDASKLGYLIVIVNNDEQAILKKGFVFMPCEERIEIVRSIGCVNRVVKSIDEDLTVYRTIMLLANDYPVPKSITATEFDGALIFKSSPATVVFAKGGDSTYDNVPEMELCKELGIKVVFGCGGAKIQSSSKLVGK